MDTEFSALELAIADLKAERVQLLAYCASKLKSGDFHGVADAAMDLREIDAKLDVLVPLNRERSTGPSPAGTGEADPSMAALAELEKMNISFRRRNG